MITYSFLQHYWWILISILGAVLVFMLFVQGGQSMLATTKDRSQRSLMVNSLGRKWELTFTSLVVFGGAFFASFPLFYSTSFGGAYWLWMLILFTFVVQAVSYKYRSKDGNVYGTDVYDIMLTINGIVAPVLLGVAVAMMFFGGEFTIAKNNILGPQAAAISQWSGLHGLEAILSLKNLSLGFTVLFFVKSTCIPLFHQQHKRQRYAPQTKERAAHKQRYFRPVVFNLYFNTSDISRRETSR